MDIKFKINLTLKNIKTNKLKTLTKTITKKDVNIEKNIPLLLDNNFITSYFKTNINKFCKDSNINQNILSVHSYDIESKTKDVGIYFDVEDVNKYSLNPRIYAKTNSDNSEMHLFCEQIDDNTIKWYWDIKSENAKLIDDKNTIITETNNYINYYIESNLDPNKTYTRILVVGSYKSLPCSLTLKNKTKSSVYSSLILDERNEDIVENDNIYSSRLSAFSSGVGDNLDCKLFKPYDSNYGKNFRLLNKIYGVRSSNTVKHHTVKFKYRYKMVGVIDYPSYDGFARVNISATPISKETNEPTGETIYCRKSLDYTFDNDIQVADIYYRDIIPELDSTKVTKYRFNITISKLKGDLTIYSYTNGYRRNTFNDDTITFSENGYGDYKISITSSMIMKQMEYVDYYPPKQHEPLVNVVNGDFEVTEDGKKDYTETAYLFAPPESVYDKKYFCIIEEFSPKNAYVKYKFKNEVENKNYTLVNGDNIVFTSDAIIENDTEYRDFIAQTEEGEFYIDDNRKHTYNYKINDVVVNIDKYKRFELDVVANTNDINILDHTKEIVIKDGKVDTDITVTVRAINNAIAKWEVLIHNGYYYYNQEERYLYSRPVMNGQNMILEDIFTKYNVSTKISVEASNEVGEIERYDVSKKTKEDLLLDRNLFFWHENRIWPAPINVSGKYYDFLEEYIYETEPFKFNNKPTSIDSITWNQVCRKDNSIDVYAISYNHVYGEWNDPIKIDGESIPAELESSKIIKLRFVLKPSRLPNLVTESILLSSENRWNTYMDSFLSRNLYFRKEHVTPKSIKSDGVYISNIFDLGDTKLELKERGLSLNIYGAGEFEVYIQHSDNKVDFENRLDNSKWEKIKINSLNKGLKRYCRFKIVLKPNSKINYMDLALTRYEYDEDYSKYIPSIGDIRITAEYNPILSTNIYEQVITKELPFDLKDHVAIPSLIDFIHQMSINQRFEMSKIVKFYIAGYGNMKDEFTVKYNQNEITSDPVIIASNRLDYDSELIEKNQNGVIFEISDDTLEVTPIPQQYAPIIITEEFDMKSKITSNDAEPLTNVFFINEDGEFSLYNTEEFVSLGFKTLYLQYTDIDESSVIVNVNGNEITDFNVIDNIIQFNEVIQKDYLVNVKYKIKNSYCVNYDYENDKAIIHFNKGNNTKIEKIKIFYETNKESSTRKLENINLNPIYNTIYNGYIYICDYSLSASSISLHPSTTFLYANGKDEANILILIKDKHNNPVENVKANIVCANGKIVKLKETTDENGIIPCIYTSTDFDCIDTIKAIAAPNIKASINITNRKL